MSITGINVIHEGVEITTEGEGIAEREVILRIFAVIISKNKESQTFFVEREGACHARQIIDTEMAENDA